MGIFASKPVPKPNPYARKEAPEYSEPPTPAETPRRRPNPPPSPAKHLMAVLLRRHASMKPNAAEIAEGAEAGLDKSFGLSKKFASRFEVGEEVGRGHFGYTCSAIAKKGDLKSQKLAVKIIPKSKMTTAVAIEDVRREVKILRALTGHRNLARFHEAFEDSDNVYIVMEGGKFSEDYARTIIVQILNVVAFCHLQGVIHRDIKPENFLFSSKHEDSEIKAIDFGLSDIIRPDQKLNEIVGSAYYVAPEVLRRSYGTEADVWSIGVIAYILLCGSRPFWARTESGIFRAVLKACPRFDDDPWPSSSSESKDFVRCLLCKDPSRRITAAQALCHPWLRDHEKVQLQLDVHVFRPMRAYMRSSPLRRAALRALSKILTADELFFLEKQFALLCPDANEGITLETIKKALMRSATEVMKESRVLDFLEPLNALGYRKMHREEFCAAALSIHQLEIGDGWEERAQSAYEIFEKDGNRAILIQELASELGLSPSVPIHTVLQEYIRHSDGKLTLPGFIRLLHSLRPCSPAKTP
ncbi:CDPK-related protein kinase-like isoform X2 [Salvia miltiorrhiza]|uniref:CDPK-related protein kinase-like isoform X2 n=1 Tax=Salvia miltiorrhiza TaxID=226208 RepID=UPI0025AB9C9E|nr:CDPK-related protein kinase-like isoform X2 [Salvia miltiorrhiza]